MIFRRRSMLGSGDIGEHTAYAISATAGFEVGFEFGFTGSLKVDWGDGTPHGTFSDSVELTHTYAVANSYTVRVYGNRETITRIVADNNRITSITDLKANLLDFLNVKSNLLTGVLNLSNSPISGTFFTSSNTGLTGFAFAPSGNGALTNVQVDFCNLSSLDFATPNILVSGTVYFNHNPNLPWPTFAANSSSANLRGYNCSVSGNLDLGANNFTISGLVSLQNNTGLTGFTAAPTGNGLVAFLRLDGCNLSFIDMSGAALTGTLQAPDNTNLSSLALAPTGNGLLTLLSLRNCNFSSLSFANIGVSGTVLFDDNANLTSLSFAPTGNGVLTTFSSDGTQISNIDYSVFSDSSNVSITITNNGFTATEHDNQLINLYNEAWTDGDLGITDGNTARTAASDVAYNWLTNPVQGNWLIF